MIRYEWKKLLFKRRGLALIAAFLAAQALLLLFLRPYDEVLERNRAVYENYLAQVEGPLTAEKRAYLETEMERLNSIHQELEQLKLDYYSGTVSEEDYRLGFDRLQPEDAKYTGFSKLYSQYIYVRESPDRSFLYTGGWETLLTDWEPDYLMLMLLILLLTPIFCEEYTCNMDDILRTQKHSARYHVGVKLTVALCLTGALTAAVQTMELVFCAVRFGLPDGSYSLQSVMSFGSSPWKLSLWEAFWVQFGLKELGYLYCAVLILFLSVLLEKFSLTLMASVALLPLPFLTLEPSAFLTVPGPWVLTIGSICLRDGQLPSLIVVGLLMIGMILFLHQKSSNHQLRQRFLPCAILILLPILAGCTNEPSPVIWNRSESNTYETERYSIRMDYDGATLTDLTDGTQVDFPLDSAANVTITCGSSIFGRGDTVWYLRTTTHQPYAGWDTIHTDCDLVKLDLTTMQESVVYQWNEDQTWFFGLLDRESMAPNSYLFELLFVHGDKVYYLDSMEYAVMSMDLLTGHTNVVLSSLNSQDLAYDGENLYYLDSYNRLVIHNLNSGTKQAIDEVVANEFLLTPDGIYFQNRRDDSIVYYWNYAENSVQKSSKADVNTISG